MKSDTEIYALLADADPAAATDLDTSALTLRIESALGHGLATPVTEPTRKETTMVTQQQPDIEIPTTTPTRQRSRGPLVAAAAAVVVILVGIGIAYAAGAFDSKPDPAARLGVATELVDTWNQGWENYDPEVVMSVFTDDGVFIDDDGNTWTMENLDDYVYGTVMLSDVDRVGGLTLSGDDTYTWVGEFVVTSNGNRFRANWEIELDGDWAARIENLGYFEEIGPASDS